MTMVGSMYTPVECAGETFDGFVCSYQLPSASEKLREACDSVARHPDTWECEPCGSSVFAHAVHVHSTSRTTAAYHCGQPACTDAVWSTQAANGHGTCGTQIEWVKSNLPGYEEITDACHYVATQSTTPECAGCAYGYTFRCERPACTEAIWMTQAANGLGTCGEQIEYAKQTFGISLADACQLVATNLPTDDDPGSPECAPCGPGSYGFVGSDSRCEDNGMLTITSVDECTAAAAELGYLQRDGDGAVAIDASLDRPHGCTWLSFGNNAGTVTLHDASRSSTLGCNQHETGCLCRRQTGEEACEGHGYTKAQCESVGCCQFAECPINTVGPGECHSNVGRSQCAHKPFSSHVESHLASCVACTCDADVNCDGLVDDADSLDVHTCVHTTGCTIYEAEAADAHGPRFFDNLHGHSGTGFMDFESPSGDYIEWTVDAPAESTAEVSWKYALDSSKRDLTLTVNGEGEVMVEFEPSGSWTAWTDTDTYTITLRPGSNAIRLTASGMSGGNIDYMNLCKPPTCGARADVNGDGVVAESDTIAVNHVKLGLATMPGCADLVATCKRSAGLNRQRQASEAPRTLAPSDPTRQIWAATTTIHPELGRPSSAFKRWWLAPGSYTRSKRCTWAWRTPTTAYLSTATHSRPRRGWRTHLAATPTAAGTASEGPLRWRCTDSARPLI